MLSECLGDSSMCLGVPFIAPRQLGPLEANKEGYPCLLSPPDSHGSCPVRDLLPILAQSTVADSWQLAHRTLFGAHRTV
jgi:hypothetical protein